MSNQPMHEIRNRIVRPATPEELERHATVRQQIEGELPDLKRWAREAEVSQRARRAVGTVFLENEAHVVEAIDKYAADHALPGRGAVVREALAHLLGIQVSPIADQPQP